MLERRIVPRYPFERPVELSSPQGRQFVAEGCDISAVGICMTLSHAAVVALAQGGGLLTPGDAVQVEIALPMAQQAAEVRLAVACRVSHVRRQSQDRYIVAARFANLRRAEQETLKTLLAGLDNSARC
jgi:hypothetical protein